MEEVEVLRIRVRDLEIQLFESHIGVCWGAPNCRCGAWCRCPHRKVGAQLPKCCGNCRKVLRDIREALRREEQKKL